MQNTKKEKYNFSNIAMKSSKSLDLYHQLLILSNKQSLL